jgi:predicted helicase
MKEVLTEIDTRGKTDRDPFTFFYEDFLSAYDPEKRKHLGVYYTPRPVVSFIVNSINHILKNDFNKLHGFADDDVTVLDPAVGTGTFLWLIYTLTLVELKNKGLGGLISKKIENHILRHFYGLEILITPYIIAHLKLSLALKKWFYELKDNDRNQVYLANTLEPSESHGLMPFMKEITEESKVANRLKQVEPILVVTGNPPYSVNSSNKSEWIMEKMKDYKRDLNERNIQPLDDDYIKFIRFAQWKIDQNNQGIIGFITNNSYLDGLIHRQMRKELLNSFDRIYILNLHGDARKKETCPDGSKDENVFDIQQGVAIGLFVKNSKLGDKKVFFADLYGTRDEKYFWLDRNKLNTVKWQELKPEEPYYFFTPKKFDFSEQYRNFWSVTDIFVLQTYGIKSSRDDFVVGFNKEELYDKLNIFTGKMTDSEIKKRFNLKDTKTWNVSKARTEIVGKDIEKMIKRYAFRPLDTRWIIYDKALVERDRFNVMKNLLRENMALVCIRQSKKTTLNTLVTDCLGCCDFVTNHSFFFPLYSYDDEENRKSNFTNQFIDFMKARYPNQNPSPEEIMYYVYAVLHSQSYRETFREFLKIDFPRIPFAKDYGTFEKLSQLGKQLAEMHLMRAKLPVFIKFDVPGSNVIEYVEYKDKKAHINEAQFFEGISEQTWNFCIGNYQVLDKWLKSRKNRELSGSEIEQFIQITEIINQTLDLMKKIDDVDFLTK